MKVQIKRDATLAEPELTLRVPVNLDPAPLVAQLHQLGVPDYLTLSQRGEQVRLAVTAILFCEATGHQVTVHTATAMYGTREPLYKLADQLPKTFLRVSKSAVVNLDLIASLYKSLTGNLIRFHQSHKQLYVSRRYYRPLKQALERRG